MLRHHLGILGLQFQDHCRRSESTDGTHSGGGVPWPRMNVAREPMTPFDRGLLRTRLVREAFRRGASAGVRSQPDQFSGSRIERLQEPATQPSGAPTCCARTSPKKSESCLTGSTSSAAPGGSIESRGGVPRRYGGCTGLTGLSLGSWISRAGPHRSAEFRRNHRVSGIPGPAERRAR